MPIVFSELIILISILQFLYLSKGKDSQEPRKWIFNPNAWLVFSFSMIFLIAPFVRRIGAIELPYVFSIRNWSENVGNANVLCAISITSLTLGNMLASNILNKRPSRRLNVNHLKLNRPNQFLSIFLSIFWLILFFLWVRDQGGILTAILSTRSEQSRFQVDKTNGYGVDAIYAIEGILLIWIVFLRSIDNIGLKRKLTLRIIFGLYFIILIPSIFNGDRSKFIFFLLAFFLALNSTGMQLKKPTLLIIIILLGIAISIPRVYRASTDVSLSSAVEIASSSKTYIDTLSQEDLAMAPALSILINQDFHDALRFQGTSYVSLISKPVPRKLWQNKPIPFDVQIMRNVFPNESKFVGYAFSCISEPYANFGLIGVVVFFLVLGLFNFYISALAKSTSIWKKTSCLWWVAFMFILARGNLTTDIQRVLFPLLNGAMLRISWSDRFRK